MKTFVIDTNVIVSAFLSANGSPSMLLFKMGESYNLAYDNRIICEYLEVLSRPRFKLGEDVIKSFIASLMIYESIMPISISENLPDDDDKIFIEVALATKDKIIVTGNTKHYPPQLMKKLGITILSPAEALKELA